MIVQERDGTFDGCQFPVYDAHGNMVLTIARSGSSESSPAYTSSNRRAFDVWGSVRASDNLGNPTNKQRYCANLGHVEDDESGLIYMRARFYEPWTGRFVSEDPAKQGLNWYAYCLNNPTNLVDESGNSAKILFGIQGLLACMGLDMIITAHIAATYIHSAEGIVFASTTAAWGVTLMTLGFLFGDHDLVIQLPAVGAGLAFARSSFMSAAAMLLITTMTAGAATGAKSMAHLASASCYVYGMLLFSMMLGGDNEAAFSTLLIEMSHSSLLGGGH